MKKLRLFPAIIAIVLAFGCNRNPEEQKSKAIIEGKTKAVIEEKPEILKEEKSNSYAFSPKPESKKNSGVKPVSKNRLPITEEVKELPKSEFNLEKAEVEISENLYDIFKRFEKPFQTFTFSPQKDTVLLGLEGTTLKINANSFVTENANKPVTGPIQIKLREYYSISDILLANLSTKSGNTMLETGGMVYLEAYSGSEKLKLKSGRQIEIGFPYKEKKQGMQVFNGNWRANIIEWIPADTTSSILIPADVMPTFPGGQVEMQKFLSAQLNYPSKAKKQGIDGLVVLSFIVQKDGNLSDLAVLRSVAPDIDAEALRVVKLMPKWSPGRKNEIDVPVRFTLPVRFSIDGGTDRLTGLFNTGNKTKDKEFAKNFERVNIDSLQTSNINSMSLYLLSTTNLGWINYDRFYDKKPNINFAIQSNNASKQDAKIIFHKIKSVLPGIVLNDKIVFQNIPKNEKVTIISLKTENNKPYLAIRETNTSNILQEELAYEEVTMEKLKEEMQKLNKLN